MTYLVVWILCNQKICDINALRSIAQSVRHNETKKLTELLTMQQSEFDILSDFLLSLLTSILNNC